MGRKESGVLENVKTFLFFSGATTFVFFTVVILPFLFGIYLTFTNWDGIARTYLYTGFDNYISAFQDQRFWNSLLLTVRYVFFVVLFTNIIAFLLGYVLSSGVRAQNLLRAGFFLPNLIGGIILGLLWNFIFLEIFTFIGKNYGIDFLSTSWLGRPDMAFWALVVVSVWQYSGYMMIIYIAGFMNLPKDVLEAANIDGARGIGRFTRIILPLMLPSINICVFLTLQRSFMVYDVNLALTGGGPFDSTQLISMYVYEKAFLTQDYGVGQAQAFFLFLVIAIVTVTQIYFSKKREVEA